MDQPNPLRAGLRIARTPEACTVVIFGATGDLTARKLLPALYNLAREGMVPAGFSLLGVGRRPWSDDDFRAEMRKSAEQFSRVQPINEEVWQTFAEGLFWVGGEFGDINTYEQIASRLEQIDQQRSTNGNRLFYLAIPPSWFDDAISNLQKVKLTEQSHGWSRIIVEKPFGHDYKSAQELNDLVSRAFDESQVYRIDHYLGKETVQNLLVARFANAIFEPIWNRNYIDHVQITVAESLGIGSRAGFYEEAGALRDMITNHMMQLLTLTAMEPPVEFNEHEVRSEKVKVLHAIRPMSASDVDQNALRAQYDHGTINGDEVPGYLAEKGVNPASRTPTFVALKFEIDNWRWAGVPFYLRTGKRLAKRVTEIAIQFKKPPLLLFPEIRDDIESNVLALRIQPNEGITLKFSAKQPGQRMIIHPVNMDFRYGSSFGVAAPEAYERLLLDAMLGDPTLFTRRDEVEAQWALMTPILERWENDEIKHLPHYEAGTWGPDESDQFMQRDGREWRKL
ncbi:glucose-6-phosphate dehydrogenase [Herpetosiphon geysericola]|uniref:Glucose-6-phosphate 1-dehydrogenase n=1 Tax=Herpetosiphon geysericola TaxID=70996 RepID=A0A0P6XZX5_9CHLR|nr:glucose-6-phosphate dehydrogenase [Herpetosiphon geysericola]KPL90587.1 glucose-6-phosphate dehydrogenase [Herpetosiphon geysericola]